MLKLGVMVEHPSHAPSVGAVEILGRSDTLPVPSVLARWRAEMDEETDVIVTAPRNMTAPLPGGNFISPFHPLDRALAVWERLRAAMEVLESGVVLFRTGPEFTPTRQNQDRIVAFLDSVAGPRVRLVWQPRGLWTPEDLDAVTSRCPVVVARDPLSEEPPPESWVYWRVWGLGRAELGPADLEHLLDLAQDDRREGYCILATGTWKSDVRALSKLVSRLDHLRQAEP